MILHLWRESELGFRTKQYILGIGFIHPGEISCVVRHRLETFSTLWEEAMLEGSLGANLGQSTGTKASILKVSATSRATAVAGAIAGVMREHHFAEVQAIGAAAVNQAVKTLAIARRYLEEDQIDIVCVPTFMEVDIDGQE